MPEIVTPIPVEVKVEDANTQQAPAPGTQEYLKGMAEAFQKARNGEAPVAQAAATTENTTTQTDAEKQAAEKAEKENLAAANGATNELTVEGVLAFINKHLGTTLASAEEIKVALEGKPEKERLDKIVASFSEFTPEELARIKAGRELKDYTIYDKIMNLKPSELNDKEALREEFILKNSGESPKWIEKQFERDFRSKYLIAEPEDKDDDSAMAEYKDEKDYREESLKKYGKDARKYIESKQEELKKYGIVEGVANRTEQEKLIKEKAAELRTNWTATVDKTLENATSVSFDIDGIPVTVAMDVADKAEVRKTMDDPYGYLQKVIGYNPSNHTFDPQKLFRFAMKEIAEKNLLKTAYTAGATQKHEELLKKRTETPISVGGDGTVKLTPREDALQAAKQIHDRRNNSVRTL